MDENKRNPIQKFLSIRGMRQVMTSTVGLIIIFAAFSLSKDSNFFTGKNVTNLLRQIAPIIIIGVGQSYVLITSNIDLSIGSVVGMSTMISATLMVKGANPIVASLVALACSVLIGVANGQFVARFGLPPFIATLGSMSIARGIAQLVNGNYNTDSIGSSPAVKAFKDLFYYKSIGPIYSSVLIAILIWAVFFFIISKTRTGRHIYAIGSNVDAARLSGVDVVMTTTKSYIVSSFCAGIVGLILTAKSGVGQMDAGTSYEMFAVAASVIGGISTLGGQGNLIGVLVGAAIWSTLENGLQMIEAPLGLKNIAVGTIVIVAVLLDVIVRKRSERR